jgi:hypothetical protein
MIGGSVSLLLYCGTPQALDDSFAFVPWFIDVYA